MGKVKQKLQDDIREDYTESQVETILKIHGLPSQPFWEWMYGQTCPMIEVDGKQVPGVFGHDLYRYIRWKTEGVKPLWD